MARCLRDVRSWGPPHSDDSETIRVQLKRFLPCKLSKVIFPEIHFYGDGCVAERTFRVNFLRFV